MNWNRLQSNNVYNIIKYTKKKKKRTGKPKLGKKRRSPTEFFAMQLNKNVPKSEQWFRELYASYFYDNHITAYKDEYNGVIGNMIMDLLNRKFKYVVEIDGSIHDSKEQQLNDRVKDSRLMARGYKIFRIPAYNEDRFKEVLTQILEIRNATVQ